MGESVDPAPYDDWPLNTLMAKREHESWGDFIGFMRMEPAMFHELLMRLTQRLNKVDTNWWKALEPDLKSAVTLQLQLQRPGLHLLRAPQHHLHVPD